MIWWLLRSIWKARARITKEEIERLADKIEAEDRAALDEEARSSNQSYQPQSIADAMADALEDEDFDQGG